MFNNYRKYRCVDLTIQLYLLAIFQGSSEIYELLVLENYIEERDIPVNKSSFYCFRRDNKLVARLYHL